MSNGSKDHKVGQKNGKKIFISFENLKDVRP